MKTALLLPVLLLAGCAAADRELAERQRDARLAGLLMTPRDLPKPAEPGTSSGNDDYSPPDQPEQNRCKDKDRRGDKGDKGGKCGRDEDKHDKNDKDCH